MRHRRSIPGTVTDILLWLLASDVAESHPPHPDRSGRCANLRCTHEAYPCPPARDAHRAREAATRPTPPAHGRAQVIPAATARRFAGWFRPTRSAISRQQRPPTPRAA
ncbi:hypothetical protein [Micromonospora sp. CB01531]|uniref:hypothetical protein n=1 Tax=Micromonospora sp. CB01531 TaxID=1718947 RepID=UPI00094003B6|nr:hypothetical protein [Micromonospora sp. CB01531]OKI45726.1 hypothetical protein A6A27_37945 [Micromonospora sp. CB01531]